MSALRPAARLAVDGRELPTAQACLGDLRVELSTGGAHDLLHLVLDPGSPFAAAAAGAEVALRLGYDDDLEPVFTGTVAVRAAEPGRVVLTCLGRSARLSATRVGRSWLSTTVAGVARDLLAEAGVEPGELDAPAGLPSFAVDERRSAWQHLCGLARLSGSELTSDGRGRVNLRPPRTAGPGTGALRHGADLVAWSVGPADVPEPAVAVVPHGAASERGASGWHLLLREPDGGPPSGPTRVPAALRDRDAAVRAGDVLDVRGLPGGGPGPVRAVGVRHLFGGAAPFVTLLAVEAAR